MTQRKQKEWVSVYLVFFLLFLRLTSCTNYFEIYRRRSGSQQDSFQTPQSLCGTVSSYSCHDYGAQQTTCNSCTCPSSNGTFGYIHDQWLCIGKNQLRHSTGCSITIRGEQLSQPILLVRTGSRYYIDLPMNLKCSYNFAKDTYYRTCNGMWSAAGSIGSGFRYVLDVIKRQNRYRYWLNVKDDSRAIKILQGRMIKLNITCSKDDGTVPWNECFLFKEPYFNRSISCPIYQMSRTIKPTPSFSGTTSSFEISTLLASPVSNATRQADKEAQKGINKKIVIGVSSAVVALLVLIATIVCIVVCYRRRKRNNAAIFAAALYNTAQDQCSAGIYDETHINLPSSLKSASLMSHSNPSYARGQDMSIKLKTSRHGSSPSRLQHDESQSVDESKFIENGNMFTDTAVKAQPIKGRRNMIVAYENVIVLADTPRDSVPDEEAFYENPGANDPHYHVLERPQEVPSYASCPSGSLMDKEDLSVHEEVAHNPYNDNDDEPIYANSPSNPASTEGNTRDSNFSFEQKDLNNYVDDKEATEGNNVEDWDIYANSEVTKSSCLKENAIDNPGYAPDDGEEFNSQDLSIEEPIYDNQVDMVNRVNGHSKSGPPPYALLRDQPNKEMYKDLKGTGSNSSNYQSLSPVTTRKKPKPKTKPKPLRKQ